ncbi:MAG TPA: arylesterase [Silvibacterium sp.]|nr:arylesterase [Silvibacterium sp.]
MKRFFALLLFALTPFAPAKTGVPKPVIVCFGDSITAGYGIDPGHGWPDELQERLDARGYKYRVLNFGVSGDTTKDGVSRLPQVLAAHPQIVVVEFGGNDGLRGLPITSTRANLDQIIQTLQGAGIKVALAGIVMPPQYGPDYARDFRETFAVAAKKFNVPLFPFILLHVYKVPGALQEDGIHPTAKGADIIADDMYEFLKPMLRK